MAESPVKGESKKTAPPKPGYSMQPVTEAPKMMSTLELSDTWGTGDVDVNAGRVTCSQAKETASPIRDQGVMTPLIQLWPAPPMNPVDKKGKAAVEREVRLPDVSHYPATAYSGPMIWWRFLAAADVRRALFSSPSVDRPMCAKQHHT